MNWMLRPLVSAIEATTIVLAIREEVLLNRLGLNNLLLKRLSLSRLLNRLLLKTLVLVGYTGCSPRPKRQYTVVRALFLNASIARRLWLVGTVHLSVNSVRMEIIIIIRYKNENKAPKLRLEPLSLSSPHYETHPSPPFVIAWRFRHVLTCRCVGTEVGVGGSRDSYPSAKKPVKPRPRRVSEGGWLCVQYHLNRPLEKKNITSKKKRKKKEKENYLPGLFRPFVLLMVYGVSVWR
jgi:hypothetical protein